MLRLSGCVSTLFNSLVLWSCLTAFRGIALRHVQGGPRQRLDTCSLLSMTASFASINEGDFQHLFIVSYKTTCLTPPARFGISDRPFFIMQHGQHANGGPPADDTDIEMSEDEPPVEAPQDDGEDFVCGALCQ